MQDHVEEDAARIAAQPGGRRLMVVTDLGLLVNIWRRWHLNQMRAGCEHQRATWNVDAPIEFEAFSIDWDDRQSIERTAAKDAAALGTNPGQLPKQTPRQREEFRRYSHAAALLWTLDSSGVRPFSWQAVSGRALGVLAQSFEIIAEAELPEYRKAVANHRAGLPWKFRDQRRPSFQEPKPPLLKRTEKKTAAWVRPEEHPDGLLCKPCEVCGYKYGSAWLKEELPAQITEQLREIAGRALVAPSAGAMFERMGLTLACEAVSTRPGAASWAAGSRHYLCKLRRGRRSMSFHFSQGPAITHAPGLAGVMECLISDASLAADESEAQACGVKLSEWPKLRRQAQILRALLGEHAETVGL
jgi:hypothetical protein